MNKLKFYMRSENFFVVHETENPVFELTEENLLPCIKVGGTFMYVLKSGQIIYMQVVTKETLHRDFLEVKMVYNNVPFHVPGDKFAIGIYNDIETATKQFLEYIKGNMK